MTPTEKGRFCAACSKTVVDFRNMGTREILDQLSASSGKTCGRFSPHQLGEKELTKPKPYAKYLAAAGIIAALGITKLDAQVRLSKSKVSNTARTASTDCTKMPTGEIILLPDRYRIKGRVLNEEGTSPLAGATVSIDGSKISTITDAEGYFELGFDKFKKGKPVNVSVHASHYEGTGFCVKYREGQFTYQAGSILLEEYTRAIMGDVYFDLGPTRRTSSKRVRVLRSRRR